MKNFIKPVVMLENPKYSGNIGSVARLNANFGLSPIRIVGTPTEFKFDMEWMAYGAEEELSKISYFEKIEDARKDLTVLIGTGMIHGKDRGQFIGLEKLSGVIAKNSRNAGIVFGREDRGLTRSVIDHCDYMIDFCLPGNQPSMNLSHSVAYVLGALYNSIDDSDAQKIFPSIDKNHFYALSKEVFGLLDMNDFHGSENLALKRLKSILDTRPLEKGDLDFLYKIFRSIQEKIKPKLF
ncbi:MAG: RNA methyltransferase [Leptospiraceae bacterium]|nr:RNA methyltransferase [Leptospiraceae bacterium]